eukprot:358819_1
MIQRIASSVRIFSTLMSGRGHWRGRGGGRRGRGYYGGGGGGGGHKWRGRGERKRQRGENWDESASNSQHSTVGETSNYGGSSILQSILHRIDGKQYGAYHGIGPGRDAQEGKVFDVGGVRLIVDYVQSDPYASTSRFRVQVPTDKAGFSEEMYTKKIRNIALCDYLTRKFHSVCKRLGADVRSGGSGWHGAKGGDLTIDRPGQHVLERTSVTVDGQWVEARFGVGLPAQGRKIMGQWALDILTSKLPQIAQESMYLSALDENALWNHIRSVEDQEFLRSSLFARGLVGFVRNGAVLPRQSGASDAPMNESEAIKFQSPTSLQVSFDLPHSGQVIGMGLQKGISLIVGGGFHGKSTLLNALELGIYNHIPGDGREFVCSSPTAFKVRAEDGRAIAGVDISAFIGNLPFGRSTDKFCSADASGSTSQAANIIEALEVGSDCLLVDEDTCATNFMIRDKRMQRLVSREKEPITPFIEKVRSVYTTLGVSSILVIGGSGSYFDVADTVVMMDCYTPRDVSQQAKAIAESDHDVEAQAYGGGVFPTMSVRAPIKNSVQHCLGGKSKTKAVTKGKIMFGSEEIDLSLVEQLGETSQTRAIVQSIMFLARKMDGRSTLSELLNSLSDNLDENGLDILPGFHHNGTLSRPRMLEVACALNRLRSLKVNTNKTTVG